MQLAMSQCRARTIDGHYDRRGPRKNDAMKYCNQSIPDAQSNHFCAKMISFMTPFVERSDEGAYGSCE